MKKLGLLFCVMLFMGKENYAQNISPTTIIPPSPEAAAFAKYGTYPVGTFTGKPNIDIPVYEIKTRKLKVPISLSYDATGIRVEDISSWVGMNWNLNAGGIISRMVVKDPDEEPNGFIGSPPPRAGDISGSQSDLEYFKVAVEHYGTQTFDTEPDKFYYSFAGRSGSFVFDRTGNIKQMPETSIKISFITSPSDGKYFKIINDDGTVYLFKGFETTHNYNTGLPVLWRIREVITGWYLSEIISDDGIEHIYFTYENEWSGSARSQNYFETYGDDFLLTPNGAGGTIATPMTNVYKKSWSGIERTIYSPRLKTISFTNGKLEFNRVQDRQDDQGSRLDEIMIYQKKSDNSFTLLRSFKLQTGYFVSSAEPANTYQSIGYNLRTQDLYRLRLDELKLKDAAGIEVSSYKFYYNNGILPPKFTCSQDWWGYYNGSYNQTTVPQTTTITGATIGQANRVSNETYMKYGTLEKIVYPTGGYTIFEMEPHRYFKNQIQKVKYYATAQGIDIPQLQHKIVTTFTTPANIASNNLGILRVNISPYDFSFPNYNDWGNQQNVSTPYVKVKNLATGQEQVFYSNNQALDFILVLANFAITPNTSYELTASCFINKNTASAQISLEFDAPGSDPLSIVGGLRVRSIKNYDCDNTLLNQESYRYGKSENQAGVFTSIDAQTSSYYRSFKVYHKISLLACAQEYGTKQNFTGGIIFDQALIQGSPVVYTEVTKYYGTPESNSGKTKYYYDDNISILSNAAGQANLSGVYIVNNSWKDGNIIKEENYKNNNDGTYSLVSIVESAYNKTESIVSYGLITNTRFDKIDAGCMDYSFYDYAYAEYPVYTGYVQLAKRTEKNYVTGGMAQAFQKKTDYVYDAAHPDYLSKTSTVNSKGELLETSIKYPFNKADIQATGALTTAESNAIDEMINRNLINVPIEEVKKNNSVQLNRTRTAYELINTSIIAPVNKKLQIANNPIETRIVFSRYDNYGNLLEQALTNNIIQCYIWGYDNALPIAEVKGALQKDIFYTSFEDAEGNSTENDSKTGRRSRTNGYSKGFSGLTNGPYIISYWSKSAGVWTFQKTSVNVTGGTYTVTLSGQIDEVRFYPSGAEMTNYTYDPLIGILSSTDINDMIGYYEYDNVGRLQAIKDEKGYIIKTLEYKYKQ
jgi:hypothetical protein